MQRYRITYDQSRPNSREGGGYPNGSEGIRKTWWRSEIDRELERSQNLADWKKQKREEREREEEEEERKNRGRKIASFTALSHLPSLWSFFSFEKIFSQANLFPMVSVAKENTRRYLVSCTPSLDEIGFRWPPNVFRYSFLIGSPLDRVTFFRKRLPSSLLSSFLSFFRSVFEQKRRHFSTDRPSPLSFLFLSSFHPLASPPRGCTPEARGE